MNDTLKSWHSGPKINPLLALDPKLPRAGQRLLC